MGLSGKEIAALDSCEGLPLWARLKRDTSRSTNASSTLGNYRFERWKSQLLDSSGELIKKRCALGASDYESALSALQAEERREWGEPVSPAIALEDRSQGAPAAPSDPPFADILYPIADRALHAFKRSLREDVRSVAADQVFRELSLALLRELSAVSHHALYEEFALFRRLNCGCGDALLFRGTRSDSTHIYDAFRKSVCSGGGAAFYREYPVLRRLVPLILRRWSENAREILEAFHRDRQEIDTLNGSTSPSSIASIGLGLSDPHHGRKTVAIITLTSGGRVVFKPRPISSEVAFMGILAFLNQQAGHQLFRTMRVLARPSYGWCEYVAHSAVKSDDEARLLYRRTGALLAVLYAFRTTDCHAENLMTVDGYPMMIDLETLMHPDYDLMFEGGSEGFAPSPLYQSVVRIGLLPWIPMGSGDIDLSALGFNGEAVPSSEARYENLGTDTMQLVSTPLPLRMAGLQPPFPRQLDRGAIVECLQEGFLEGYELVRAARDEFLLNHALVSLMRTCETRFVPRNTHAYGWLYQRGLDAHALRSGVDRSLEFEALFRAAMKGPSANKWYALAEAERCALEDLDIPRFTVTCGSRDLRVGVDIVLKDAFDSSPWDRTLQQLTSLSHDDMRSQLAIIGFTFAQTPRGWAVEPSRRVGRTSREISRDEVVEKVRNIGEQVWNARTYNRKQPSSWLVLQPIVGTSEHRLAPAGSALYQGSVGIALFFAALHAATGCSVSKSRCYEALRLVISTYERGVIHHGEQFDLGDGIGGVAYGLYRIGSLLGDYELRARAARLLATVAHGTLQNNDKVDLLGGTAGFMLAAEVVNREFSSPDLQRAIQACVKQILALQLLESGEGSGWITFEGQALPGFAHGSAGITYALGRVAQGIHDAQYCGAGERGFKHQYGLYSESLRNWHELRTTNQGKALPASWCHGAVGIGLGTSGLDRMHPELCATTRERAFATIADSLQHPLTFDSACCGVAAILEFGLVAHEIPGMPAVAAQVLTHLCDSHTHRCVINRDSKALAVGLFNGISGIGYQLLRHCFPDRIPSILLFD